MFTRVFLTSLISVTLFTTPAGAQQPLAATQQPPPASGQDKVAAVKQSLKASMAALRHYE